jgi:hypothetical protein
VRCLFLVVFVTCVCACGREGGTSQDRLDQVTADGMDHDRMHAVYMHPSSPPAASSPSQTTPPARGPTLICAITPDLGPSPVIEAVGVMTLLVLVARFARRVFRRA